MHSIRLFILLGLFLSLLGCAGTLDENDETKGWSANQFYSAAKEAMSDSDYKGAIRYFELLEARYPFGRYAQQAQLESAYAYYKYEEPDSAIATLDRFIKMHPRHPNVDYAYYLKGLVNYNRGKTALDARLVSDATQRDPGAARKSFDDFSQLVNKFPASQYAKDSRQRMVYLRNLLASYEVHVADYYLRRKAYIASVNRAKYVIENYQRTPAMPDALVVMVKAYRALELEDLANDALRVFETNYPDHKELERLKR
ncbi:outer membrane protein assembly factor BamD [Solemya pervernicosa gill symbiont]|uniref:Outer membrane protein assembly factor BamD n=2 Tax=Gammaproteobacteria incertae sedis TaxID=118884 RepID=A0A1T2L5Y1_9GAMM|nr:outer membrane protein assembly factor BamD [Candidatus Reidiella endopervernicosa]OOZ40525.1 outer membrane protein assembly factor BamD [Solemya pervernicosa gill symbiont]QKQ27511.1 outer membrane protein assembly factor BamD [Candidatus Reidiella endopervernicosa]